MAEKHFYVYILASRIGGTLYIGVTNDLIRRIWEHREKFVEGLRASMTFTDWSISSSSTISKMPSHVKSV